MFDPDTSVDLLNSADLLHEVGIDRHTVRELAEDERAIRCPDRGAVYPAYGFASLSPEPASGTDLQDAAPAEPRDPASPPPAE